VLTETNGVTIQGAEAQNATTEALTRAYDKFRDVAQLERGAAELAQLFADFALLVDRQGEALLNIESQVKAAAAYVDEGNTEMVSANALLASRRKCQMVIAAVVVIVLIIIISVVASKLKN
jgi:t-SNARE complex subunit (syntaxin)